MTPAVLGIFVPVLALAAPPFTPLAWVGTLPSPRFGPSAVWDGDEVLVFGGAEPSGSSREILHYSPLTGDIGWSAPMPQGRDSTSAVFDEATRMAYVFGGISNGVRQSSILGYDTTFEDVDAVGAALPSARDVTAGAWDPVGRKAYVFGGNDGAHSAQIVRYDPAAPVATSVVVVGTLPNPRGGAAAAWDPVGQCAYVFGGGGPSGALRDIIRYCPRDNSVNVRPVQLPAAGHHMAAAWALGNFYVFGGDDATFSDQIVRYTPATEEVHVMPARLPTGRHYMAAASTGETVYLVGGEDVNGRIAQILRYDPARDTLNEAT